MTGREKKHIRVQVVGHNYKWNFDNGAVSCNHYSKYL